MGVINTAVTWAISIANDNSHRYVFGASHGDSDSSGNYDCSSFASWAYKHAGVDLVVSSTRNIKSNFENADFLAIPYSEQALKYGDIIFYHSGDNGHVVIYIGVQPGSNERKIVEAQGSSAGILVNTFNPNRFANYQWILRYKNDPATIGSYGYMGETPSIWNNPRKPQNSGEAQTVSNVEWMQTGTDIYGNAIGYSYTSQANFTPYIATVSPGADRVDYPALIQNKVSGMMFCAGWMYDSHTPGHPPRKEYINPHLKEQILECQQADLPFALYAIVRAKNRIEADKECKDLYYVVSQFPPKLGLWLYLDMHNQRLINQEILDCYYKYIVDWGLGARCGLYVDGSRLTQIEWDKYQNKFHLWLIDHVDQSTLNTINDRVLTSEFFEVG